MVIQFCQERNLIGKIMPGDAKTRNAGTGLLFNSLVKIQNSYKTPALPMVRLDF